MNTLKTIPHQVHVINPELMKVESLFNLSSVDYLKLQLIEIKEYDTCKKTIITVSRWAAPLIFDDIKNELHNNKFIVFPASLKLSEYIIMGTIITVDYPFIFGDRIYDRFSNMLDQIFFPGISPKGWF